MTRKATEYWGGPRDGEATMYTRAQRRTIPDTRYDAAGTPVVLPLGACEVYLWSVSHLRYEWQGTFAPNPSGEYVPLSQLDS